MSSIGAPVPEQLDRSIRTAAVTLRHDLTPLTSLTFSAGRSEARFETEPARDYTSDDYSAAVTFDPAALLKGSARFGYTAYRTAAADLEDYNGFTTAVSLAYTLQGSTRFNFNVGRSIESSYDINQPYYVLTGAGVSVAQTQSAPSMSWLALAGSGWNTGPKPARTWWCRIGPITSRRTAAVSATA